jgi:hypothetical protein
VSTPLRKKIRRGREKKSDKFDAYPLTDLSVGV